VRLTPRRLNRTLLLRQGLLERGSGSVTDLCRHLVGLQAQENLPPFLGLAARLTALDPHVVTRGLEERSLVRILSLRGTIHLLTADDALLVRSWTQPVHERERRASVSVRPALGVDRGRFTAAVDDALADGPLPVSELGERLVEVFPDVPAKALGQHARATEPLVQVPPRGAWKGSAGVVYQRLDRWLGRPIPDPDPPALVRRYLAAFGPATAADVTSWSGVPGTAAVLAGLTDLVRRPHESGATLFDVPGAPMADEDVTAPVRLLGTYDNLWLSHARRDRVSSPEARRRWMGSNGGAAHVVLIDGQMAGLWSVVDGRPAVGEIFARPTRAQRRELDDELDRVRALLDR
jgi:hypothetical protein